MKGVVLIGMPGSGKSTVARALARRLHCEAVDTDTVFKMKFGDISAYFDTHGEANFRIQESIIMCAYEEFLGVLSLGGGAVLNADAMTALRMNHTIVYLRASEATLANRLFRDNSRPLLRGGREALATLYKVRTPLYAAAADVEVNVDADKPHQIANQIIRKL